MHWSLTWNKRILSFHWETKIHSILIRRFYHIQLNNGNLKDSAESQIGLFNTNVCISKQLNGWQQLFKFNASRNQLSELINVIPEIYHSTGKFYIQINVYQYFIIVNSAMFIDSPLCFPTFESCRCHELWLNALLENFFLLFGLMIIISFVAKKLGSFSIFLLFMWVSNSISKQFLKP